MKIKKIIVVSTILIFSCASFGNLLQVYYKILDANSIPFKSRTPYQQFLNGMLAGQIATIKVLINYQLITNIKDLKIPLKDAEKIIKTTSKHLMIPNSALQKKLSLYVNHLKEIQISLITIFLYELFEKKAITEKTSKKIINKMVGQ
ncbi:hypothetical protein PsalN5692_03869 (plasmid) [Piscirickettsia salmonis]|uniref:hypothetical protein n=1 Tax=Piscirickettsia salmonis TaxID=1238 RepID=UPI0012B832EA|nr:hypothetical protein [Piscirickettsia salmonis]QGP52360.1 hypothetical protein PsalN5692_03869 [Piscirickettsia salmonis]